MERSFPVTTGEIRQSTTFKSENSTRIEESESCSDLSQEQIKMGKDYPE